MGYGCHRNAVSWAGPVVRISLVISLTSLQLANVAFKGSILAESDTKVKMLIFYHSVLQLMCPSLLLVRHTHSDKRIKHTEKM